jgi:putative cell wall-binding protein
MHSFVLILDERTQTTFSNQSYKLLREMPYKLQGRNVLIVGGARSVSCATLHIAP